MGRTPGCYPECGGHFLLDVSIMSIQKMSNCYARHDELRTFLAAGLSDSAFARASLRFSFACRFSLFCLRATSSRFSLFLICDGSKRLVGMV